MNIKTIEEAKSLSSVFDISAIIELETTNESLIGSKIGKIKKYLGSFYILNDNRYLLKFDEKGKLVNKLDRVGGGPSEYVSIGDYDILDNGNIVILDSKKIIIYTNEGEFIKSINLNFTGYNIKAVANNKYLICAAIADYSFYLIDENGTIISSHWKKEGRTLGRVNPFSAEGYANVLFHENYSNSLLRYNLRNESITEVNLMCGNIIDRKRELELKNQNEDSYLDYIKNDDIIGGVTSYSNYLLISRGNRITGFNIYIVDIINNEVRHIISENTIDDISFQNKLNLLQRTDKSDSYECFISYVYLSDIPEDIRQSNPVFSRFTANKSNHEIEDLNPIIVELTVK